MTQEFEYSVIGAICIDSRIIDRIAPLVAPDDFTIKACAEVYEAAIDALGRGKAFDAVYAADVAKDLIDDSSGFIRQCMDLCPSVRNAEGHAREIRKRAQTKNLVNQISEKLFDEASPQDLAADVAGICQDFLIAGSSLRYSTMADALAKVYEQATNPKKEERIETGFARLDSLLKGMPKGNLIFVGARPSVGKSAFALSVAEHVARKNGTVLLYSLEMRDDEVAERSAANASSIKMDKLIDGGVTESESKALSLACSRLGALPIKIFDTPNVTPSAVRRDARMFKEVKLIIIDFISLMGSDKKHPQNRNLELGQISRDLKNLAVELDVPILCLSQLSRNKDENTEPTLSDLRDSGELEQNANKVLFLWKVREFDDGTKEVGVSVAKNRRGRLGAVLTDFDGNYMRFAEVDFLTQEQRAKKPRYGSGVI